jgi:peroxiredoxin
MKPTGRPGRAAAANQQEERTMNKIMTCAIAALSAVLTATAGEGIQPLMIGTQIPDLTLKTAAGESLDLRAAAKEQPLVLIFYRGGWCPYCNAHLGQLQEIDPQLRELGYRIVAISPDRQGKMAESLDKIEMSYTLLSDSSMEAAKAFGIAFEVDAETLKKLDSYNIDIEEASGEKHHMLPVPAVFIVGTDGIIDFSYANPDYKIRLSPEVLLAAAKTAL